MPLPLPYFCFLLPGLVLSVWQKRYEIALLGTVSVAGAFVAAAFENRLLLAIPFWMILMAFTFSALVKLRVRPIFKFVVWGLAAVLVMSGLIPSIRYIKSKTKNPFTIYHFAQEQVAVSRFLRHIVAGKEPANPPRLERDEFNRMPGANPSFDTLICQKEAYSIIHLFLHDYDDTKVLSPSNGLPFILMPEREIWSINKQAIARYVPSGRDLKLVWETDPKTDRIVKMFEPLRDLATQDAASFSFAGRLRKFYVLNIGANNIRSFQERVQALPDLL